MKKNNNTVLLNWCPPAITLWPSPAHSILKQAITQEGVNCKVVYWNIELEEILASYLFAESTYNFSDSDRLGLFYSYIAFKRNDYTLLLREEIRLRGIRPSLNSIYFDYKDHMLTHIKKLENKIYEIIERDISEALLVGFCMHLYQWVAASVISEIIRSNYPEIPITVGGIGSKGSANAFLDVFPQYDIAMWGEGEMALIDVVLAYKQSCSLEGISQIAFRDKYNNIVFNENKKAYYNIQSELSFDYDDYFTYKTIDKDKIVIPLEMSRGCHWNKCHFCFLNDGYKYRIKRPDKVLRELEYYIGKYGIYKFSFLDNDLIGGNLKRFELLLDMLIQLRVDFPDFEIILAEIITRGLNRNLIKKMSLAGFKHVQIGYEFPGDALLSKIKKKNSFASNLLFIKWANCYGISLGGMNIIRGLLEENTEDIWEACQNILFLRFYLQKGFIEHNVSSLAISSTSYYYDSVKANPLYDNILDDSLKRRLPQNFIPSKWWFHIYHMVILISDDLWASFDKLNQFYTDSLFEYKIINNGHTNTYYEYCNHKEINRLDFLIEDIHWKVLTFANEQVRSYLETMAYFSLDKMSLESILDDLSSEGLLYDSRSREEFVSVVNTNLQNI